MKKPIELNFEGESNSTVFAFFLTNIAFVFVIIPVIVYTILTLFIHVIGPFMLDSPEEFWEEVQKLQDNFKKFNIAIDKKYNSLEFLKSYV